jgi:hypothetical protein
MGGAHWGASAILPPSLAHVDILTMSERPQRRWQKSGGNDWRILHERCCSDHYSCSNTGKSGQPVPLSLSNDFASITRLLGFPHAFEELNAEQIGLT